MITSTNILLLWWADPPAGWILKNLAARDSSNSESDAVEDNWWRKSNEKLLNMKLKTCSDNINKATPWISIFYWNYTVLNITISIIVCTIFARIKFLNFFQKNKEYLISLSSTWTSDFNCQISVGWSLTRLGCYFISVKKHLESLVILTKRKYILYIYYAPDIFCWALLWIGWRVSQRDVHYLHYASLTARSLSTLVNSTMQSYNV